MSFRGSPFYEVDPDTGDPVDALARIKVDDSVSGTTYIGMATPGSSTSAAVWRIFRIVETAGDTDMTWADGNILFDNIWDNRTGLSYS